MTDTMPGPGYEESLISGRQAATLAPKYGYDGLMDFAQSLPRDARVIDVGAGLSTLGKSVCNLRGDVEWINADVNYGNFRTRSHARSFDELVETKPKNLAYEAVDAVELADTFGVEQFDRVLSYWAIQYIMLRRRELGIAAAESMLRVAKPSGSVAVGPISKPSYGLAALRGKALEVAPAADEEGRSAQAHKIVDANTLPSYQFKNLRAVLERRRVQRAVEQSEAMSRLTTY